jgi:hypothetical protein
VPEVRVPAPRPRTRRSSALIRGRHLGKLLLAVIVVLGALGMHGLITVHSTAPAVRSIGDGAMLNVAPLSPDHGHEAHPRWHDALLCVWIVAGAVALALACRRPWHAAPGSELRGVRRGGLLAAVRSERAPPHLRRQLLMVARQ